MNTEEETIAVRHPGAASYAHPAPLWFAVSTTRAG